MTTYGYIRVSTSEQNPERQIKTMEREGISDVFIDYASGKNFDRKEFKKLLSLVKEGDKIVIDSLDRLGRDYDGVISTWNELTHDRGINIQALDMPFMDSEYFTKLGDMGKLVEGMFLNILAWVAEHERLENRRRQAQGIAVAKERGVYTGRKPTEFDPKLIHKVEEHLRNGGAKTEAAKMLGVNRMTIYRMIEEGRLIA